MVARQGRITIADEELSARIRAGDRAALDLMVRKHFGLVLSILRRTRVDPGIDKDDLVQAGLIALARAAEAWDPARTKFSTLATHAIQRRLWCVVAKERRALDKTLGCVGIDWEEMTDVEGPERVVDLPEDVDLSILSPVARQVVRLWFGLDGTDPIRPKEISARFGLTMSQVRALKNESVKLLGLVARPAA